MRTTAARARGMATVLRELPRQLGVHRLPVEELAALRDRNVRAAVGHAATHVPFYRELGLDPADLATADDLARLPLLDRKLLQRDGERFRAATAAGESALAFSTSGSTGTPVTVHRDRRALALNIAHTERERAVESALVGRRFRYPVLQVANPGGNEERVQALHGRASFRPFRPRLHVAYVRDSVEEVVALLDRVRPVAVRGYGTWLEFFFRAALDRGLLRHVPRVVVYGGDAMSAEGRALIEETLGIPVLSRYSAVEAFRIGFFCEERRGFHLHEDLCHVRVVDGDGADVPEGELGEIVVSDLVNRAQALLNYRLGDLGRILGRGCACGRTTRVLADLEGRANAVVTLPDGRTLHSVLLDRRIRKPGVLRFQLAQVDERRFELRLLLADPGAFPAIAAEIVRELETLLGDVEIDAEHRPDLEHAPGPKFRTFVPLRPPPQ